MSCVTLLISLPNQKWLRNNLEEMCIYRRIILKFTLDKNQMVHFCEHQNVPSGLKIFLEFFDMTSSQNQD